MEHLGQETEVSGQRKTDTNWFYGNTVWNQCTLNGEMTVFLPDLLDTVTPGPYTSLTRPEMTRVDNLRIPTSN